MFEFLDKVWLAWTGWDIFQAYIFYFIVAIVLFVAGSVVYAIFRN